MAKSTNDHPSFGFTEKYTDHDGERAWTMVNCTYKGENKQLHL